MPARFRGHIELVRDPETGKADLLRLQAVRARLPSDCITVEGAKAGGRQEEVASPSYMLDFTKCSLCGSCVEACRDRRHPLFQGIQPGQHDKEDYIMDLFKRLEDQNRCKR